MPREKKDLIRSISENAPVDGNWKIYAVAFEDGKRTLKYFNALCTTYKKIWDKENLRVIPVPREQEEVGNSSPTSVQKTILNFVEEWCKDHELKNYDELWMIIDVDDYDKRKNSILELLEYCEREENYHIGLSNPCIEVWWLLHLVSTTDIEIDYQTILRKICTENNLRCSTKEDHSIEKILIKIETKKRPTICKQILAKIKDDKKIGDLHQDILINKSYIKSAITRARALGNCDHENLDRITTDVYQLIEKLIFNNP